MNNASQSTGDMGYVTIIGSLTGTYITGLYRENDDKDVYHLVATAPMTEPNNVAIENATYADLKLGNISGASAYFDTITTSGGVINGGGSTGASSSSKITCNEMSGTFITCNTMTGNNAYISTITGVNNYMSGTGFYTNYGICGGTGTFSYLNVGNTGYFGGFFANTGTIVALNSSEYITNNFKFSNSTGTNMFANCITGTTAYFGSIYTITGRISICNKIFLIVLNGLMQLDQKAILQILLLLTVQVVVFM